MQAAAVLSVVVRAKGIGPTNAQLASVQGNLRKAGAAGSAMGGQIAKGTKAAGLGVGVGLGYAVKKAADFEAQMSSLRSVTSANGKQMERFRQQAMKAGADTKYSALEAAKAQTELAKGGLSAAQIMKGGLRSSLALAAAGEMDLAEAAETTANALNLFGLEGRDSMKVADMLATAANATTADVTDFAMALKQGGSVAKMAGLSFGQTVLALEALAKSGIRNADAGTSLKTAVIQLLKPTEKQAELAKKLGLNFLDSSGRMKSMADISGMLRARLGGMTAAQRTATLATLAGTDGVRTLSSLYAAGPAKLNAWEKGLNKSGTAATVAAQKQDNLKGKLENLQGSIETIAISIGSKMLPSLSRAAEGITKILNNPNLTTDEKLRRIADVLAGVIRQGVNKGAEIAAAAGPKIAKAIAEGLASWWYGANPIAKLLGVAAIIRLAGGRGALTATGATVGRFLGGGVAAGVATGAAGGAAGAAAGGGLLAKMRARLLPFAKRAGLAGVGIALADSVMSEFGRRATTKSPELFKALKAQQGNMFASPGSPLSGFGAFTKDSEHAARRLLPALQEIATKSKAISPQRAMELRQELGRLSGMSAQAKGQFASLINSAVNKGRDIRLIRNEFGRMRAGAVLDMNELRRVTDTNVRRIASSMGVHTRAGRAALRENMRLSLRSIEDFGARGQLSSREAMRAIRRSITVNSAGGKDALRSNIGAGIKTLQRLMRSGVVAADEGMKEIARLFRRYLGTMGLKGTKADIYLTGANKAVGGKGQKDPRPFQRGGVIVPGSGTGDKVPAMLEPGEVVWNRKAVRKMGGPDSVNTVNRAVPRFARGGIVGLGRQLQKQGFQVGEHPAFGGVGGHAPNSYHYRGMAIDVNADSMPGGEAKNLDRLHARLKRMPGVVELLWRVADHFNHLHVAMSGGGGKLGDLGAIAGGAAQTWKDIARLKVAGPDSPLKGSVQATLDRTRTAANERGRALAAAAGGGGGGSAGSYTKFSGKWTDLMAKIAEEKGWNLGHWKELVRRESGGNPRARNPSSGAFGIGQFLGATLRAYAKHGATSSNPVDQIRAMGRYIADRYGTATAALRFHDSHNWYRKGGIVGMAKGGIAGQLNRTLGTLRTSRKPKARSKALTGLLKNVKKIGLGTGLENALTKHTGDAEKFADMAERAQQMTVDGGDGRAQLLGKVGGKTEAQWMTDRLGALFRLRNQLVKAHQTIADRRERVTKLVSQAQKRLAGVSAEIRKAAGVKKGLVKQLKGKKGARRTAIRKKIHGIDRAQIRRTRVQSALKGRILPLLTSKGGDLKTRGEELGSSLTDVQGPGSPMGHLKHLPPVGVLGGQIFGAQMRLRELGQKPSVTDTSSSDTTDRTDLLKEALRTANLRTAVSEAQFKVLRGLPGAMQYAGKFHGGGIVGGPTGQERTAVVKTGEGIFTSDQMAAMGGGGVKVIVNGDISNTPTGMDPVEVVLGDRRFPAAVEKVNRGTARRAGRGLPSGGGI